MRHTPGASRIDEGAPDVTDDVMRRLGYELLSSQESRRRNRWRHVGRAGAFGLLLSVMVLGGVYERADSERDVADSLSVTVERAMGAQAQVFQGLRAPFERLEQALDRAISGGISTAETTHELESGSVSAPRSAPSGPTLDESAFAPFPSS